MSKSTVLLLLMLVVLSSALYDRYSAVKLVTASDFSQVKKGIWLVQFFAPWCGHCKTLAPEYENAAKALKGIANIAAIDGSNQKTDIQIKGFPTIKLFIDGKVTEYDGPRNADGIVDFMLRKFRNIANQRLGSSGSSGSHHQDHGSGSDSSDQKDVIILTDKNFDQNVFGDESAWFVEFYAPWCGHCKSLAPEYAVLATDLKGEVKVAKVDATENKEVTGKYGVQGYPTIKFFPAGKKDENSAIPYEGQRNAAAMAEWAREQTKDLKIFQQVRLISQAQYDEICKSRNLCVLTFLPHILDSSQEERATYLQKIKEVGLKFKGKPYKFLWVQGGDHFQFEEKLGAVGVGYPVVTVIYESKKVFGKLKKSFSVENFEFYLSEILNNKVRMNKLPPFDNLRTITPEPEPEQPAGEHAEGCGEDLCTAPPPETYETEAEL